jgi:serine/threonine protein kinase
MVRKELRFFHTQQQDYEHEQHILSLLRCMQHPSIIQFYTAYTLNRVPTLLFAPADYNLAEFLTRPLPQLQFGRDQAILDALYGLSSAISHVHNYFSEANNLRLIGCHYDLKPKNILVTPGRFILADFGISRLKPESDSSRSGFKAGISDYSGPECQDLVDNFEKHRIGRQSDIWSFGCILAEIASYLDYGQSGVEAFAETRKITLQGFLTIRPFHAATRPSNTVNEWLGKLEKRAVAASPRRGILALVRNMLAFDAEQRPDALNVSARLFLLAQKEIVDAILPSIVLLREKASYGCRIECVRLKIWCEAVGIEPGSELREISPWLLINNGKVFELIRTTLGSIVKEVLLQSELLMLDPVEPCNHPTHHALRRYVDVLWNALPPEIFSRLNSLLETTLLREYNLTDSLSESWADYSGSNIERARLLLAMRQAMGSVDKYKHTQPDFFTEQSVTITGELSGKELGNIDTGRDGQRSILMEFLEYEDKWVDRFDELVHRVDSLVSLLNDPEMRSLFPMLRCIKFCHIVRRQGFGLLYELPTSKLNRSIALQPITLVGLINLTQRRQKRPLLGEVFSLAHTLASSLVNFHRGGWLHKGISAFNVLFFPESPEAVASCISSPYLIGFNHSRESNEFAFTQGPSESVEVGDYQHPDYRLGGAKVRFRQEFDYYSVGVVLLELGLWKPLSKITREKKTLSGHQIRDFLLQEVPALGSYMGRGYRDAVESCLNGSLSADKSENADSVGLAFERKVVEPLLQCLCLDR